VRVQLKKSGQSDTKRATRDMSYSPAGRTADDVTRRGHITVEWLANGLYRVYDAQQRTTNNYNEDGTPLGSAVDDPQYRAAVRAISRHTREHGGAPHDR
jgi:hypothetical protein